MAIFKVKNIAARDHFNIFGWIIPPGESVNMDTARLDELYDGHETLFERYMQSLVSLRNAGVVEVWYDGVK